MLGRAHTLALLSSTPACVSGGTVDITRVLNILVVQILHRYSVIGTEGIRIHLPIHAHKLEHSRPRFGSSRGGGINTQRT